jgi:hypothetical protein
VQLVQINWIIVKEVYAGKYSLLRDKQWNIIGKITAFQNPMISTQHLQVSNCFIVEGTLSALCLQNTGIFFLEQLCPPWMSICRGLCHVFDLPYYEKRRRH